MKTPPAAAGGRSCLICWHGAGLERPRIFLPGVCVKSVGHIIITIASAPSAEKLVRLRRTVATMRDISIQ
jgi:hypothetical protein